MWFCASGVRRIKLKPTGWNALPVATCTNWPPAVCTGGAAAAAHAAFWGAILDWLAAEERPLGVAPLASLYREGDRIAWIRGSRSDSTLKAVILSYETRTLDTLQIRFGSDGVGETEPLPAGVYRVVAAGDTALLAVNVSRELLPKRPALRTSSVGEDGALVRARGMRGEPWAYLLLLALLIGEWLGRRRAGLR